MQISDLKCPCCGAPLDDVEDGRVNFFCSYCGSALCIVYEDCEADNIIRMKVVEARLSDARANLAHENAELARESAHVIEADTEQIRLKNRIKAGRHAKLAGILMIFLGCSVTVAELFGIVYFLSRYAFSVADIVESMGKPIAVAIIAILMVGIMIAIALILIGIRKIDELTEAEKDLIEERIERLRDALDVNMRLFEEQKAIADSHRLALIGKKARARKAARKRAREIKDEIAYINSQIREYESVL